MARPPRTSTCSYPGCPSLVSGGGRCGGTCCGGKCKVRKPSGKSVGYGSAWRAIRDPFIKANPICRDCGAPSTDADHSPVSRRELLAQGVRDPDAPHRLVARCHSCHSRKTVRYDGGWGNRPAQR